MAETDLARVDFEPYFLAWDSVFHYPDPSLPRERRHKIHGYEGNEAMIPCYQHRSCKALVFALQADKYPPRVCPGCGVDSTLEVDADAQPIPIDPETGLVPEEKKPKLKAVIHGLRAS